MDFMREETFGPVVGIMPVEGDEQAVALMNDSRYGLTASIWTGDADAALAWTGVKDSGRGCTLSRLGLEAFTRPKSFHFRK